MPHRPGEAAIPPDLVGRKADPQEATVAKQINPDPDLVNKYLSEIRDREEHRAHDRVFGRMLALIPLTARYHAAECNLAKCNTCAQLSRGLSLVAAYEIHCPPPSSML